MEQLRQENVQERSLRRVLGEENTLLGTEEGQREDNIIKEVRNLFRLKKQTNNDVIKDIRNRFRLTKIKCLDG